MTVWNEQPKVVKDSLDDIEYIARDCINPEAELLQTLEDMALMSSINAAANRGDSLQEIFQLLTQGTTRLFGGFGATVYLLSADKNNLEVQYLDLPESIIRRIENDLKNKLPLTKFPLQPGTYFYDCLSKQSSRILDDQRQIADFLAQTVQADTHTKSTLIPMVDNLLGLRSVMLVPFVNYGQAIGLIDVASQGEFSLGDLERLKAIALQITVIISRKQLEDQLRWERDVNAKFIESAPVLFVAIDSKGRIVMVNSAMLSVLGYAKDEVMGKDFLTRFIPEPKRKLTMETFMDSFEMADTMVKEWCLTGKDGTERTIEWHGHRVSKPGGELDYYIGVGVDVTERKKLQEQLILSDRLAVMGELVSGIAHEINNPLTGVVGFSELLLEKNIPENLCEDVAIIHHEAQRASEVVKNMLAFARKQTPSRQNVNVNSAIARVISLRAYEHKVNNISVVTHFSHDLPDILADMFQLQQVFLNIIINAEYFMRQAHTAGVLTISTENKEGKVRVSIADDGPGINPENLNNIFDPFFTTKEVGVGTGLGLSLCHGIIKEHGGIINAKSKPGEGATFIIELPVQAYLRGAG